LPAFGVCSSAEIVDSSAEIVDSSGDSCHSGKIRQVKAADSLESATIGVSSA